MIFVYSYIRIIKGAAGKRQHNTRYLLPVTDQPNKFALLLHIFLIKVNIPKTKKSYCKGKQCKKHQMHKVTQYKTGKASLYAQGMQTWEQLHFSILPCSTCHNSRYSMPLCVSNMAPFPFLQKRWWRVDHTEGTKCTVPCTCAFIEQQWCYFHRLNLLLVRCESCFSWWQASEMCTVSVLTSGPRIHVVSMDGLLS